MNRLSILETFQIAHDKYFDLLLKNYPTIPTKDPFAEFGPPELCDFAIEVQSCAISLGPKALERLYHLGFDILYPFDNIVDLYNWRAKVKKERIDHTIYSSIAIRIDAELKRMKRVSSLEADAEYQSLPTEAFLVSKARYKTQENKELPVVCSNLGASPTTHIDTLNVYTSDAQAINRLDRLEKSSSIGSNISNIISTVRSFVN